MLWNFFRAAAPTTAGELMRRAHSRWLTAAMSTRRAYPRIPVRPLSTGGFARLTSRASGRHWADIWWDAALRRVDCDED